MEEYNNLINEYLKKNMTMKYFDMWYDSNQNKYKQRKINDTNKSPNVKKSPEEILEDIDIEIIEKFLRKKKLENINKKYD